jgi:hypothetical protein
MRTRRGLTSRHTDWLAISRNVASTLELVSELVIELKGLLQFTPCELLLSEAGSWGRGQFGNPEEVERKLLEAISRRVVKTKHAE